MAPRKAFAGGAPDASDGRPAPADQPEPAYDSSTPHGAQRMLEALRDAAGRGTPGGGGVRAAARLGIGPDEAARLAAELCGLGYDVRDDGGPYPLPREYRLVPGPAPLALPWEVAGGAGGLRPPLATRRLGSRVVFYRSADSTQDRALSLAAQCPAGEADGLVVVAATQNAGRGRLGRRWVSPPGGLWMSVVAEPGPPAGAATLVPLAASIALADAVMEAAGAEADLKWPNDLLVGGRKVAGILVDASAGAAGAMDSVVVGIGVNLAVDAAFIDAAVGAPPGRAGAASLAAPGGGGPPPDPALLARAFLARLEGELEGLEGEGGGGAGGGVAQRWAARSSMIGCEVEAERGGRAVRGTAAGIDADGALLVARGSSPPERIVAGDVAAVRRAERGGRA